jgi:hypothetical protein
LRVLAWPQDGTDVFAAFHEGATWSKLKEYKLGSILQPEAKETALIQDFRKLRAELVKDGLFKTNYVYYVWKLISTTMLAIASGMVLKAYPDMLMGFLASTALVALFWQQSGWLSHDFCHNQVFKNRKVNHVLGMLTGNVYQVRRLKSQPVGLVGKPFASPPKTSHQQATLCYGAV